MGKFDVGLLEKYSPTGGYCFEDQDYNVCTHFEENMMHWGLPNMLHWCQKDDKTYLLSGGSERFVFS